MQEYTPEQLSDIKERFEKASAFLTEINMQPVAQMTPTNLGNDVFAFKITVSLQDTKFAPQKIEDPKPIDIEATPVDTGTAKE